MTRRGMDRPGPACLRGSLVGMLLSILLAVGRFASAAIWRPHRPRPRTWADRLPVEASKAIREHSALLRVGHLPLPRRRPTRVRGRPHLPGRNAKLASEGSTETGGIGKAQVGGDLADRQDTRSITEHGKALGETAALDVAGHTAFVLKNTIELRPRHPGFLTQFARTQRRGAQVSGNRLAYLL